MKKFYRNPMVMGLALAFAAGFIAPVVALAFTSQAPIDLGSSANFVILAKSEVTTTGITAVTGDIGLSPAAASFITGFSLIMDSTNTFSRSSLVTGKIYASDYTSPTPSYVGTAVGAMATAYTTANGRPVDATDIGALGTCATTCDLTGLTVAPGVYAFSGPGNVNITGDVTLSGLATDVWIFKIPGTLNISSNKKVLLTGGAVPANVFWVVAGATTIGTGATFEGNILEGGSVIALQTGAKLDGRALSQFAVTLDATTVSLAAAPVVDNTPPVVTLNGSDPVTLVAGGTFSDPGATALDNVDGPVAVVVSGSVNAAAVGSYVLTYTATDAAHNSASKTRTVVVTAPPVTSRSGGSSGASGSSSRGGGSVAAPAATIVSAVSPVAMAPTASVVAPYVPYFPNTGFPPQENGSLQTILEAAGCIALAFLSSVLIVRAHAAYTKSN